MEAPEARYTLECFPDVVCAGGRGALPVHVLGLAVGLEGEGVRGQRLIELEVEVDADAGLALSLIEDLLQADAVSGVNPDDDLGKSLRTSGSLAIN